MVDDVEDGIPSYIDFSIAGLFRFRMRPSLERENQPTPSRLKEIALHWEREHPGVYEMLHVRSCGTNQIGIELRYMFEPMMTRETYINERTDELKRRFGNDFIGWDLNPPIFVIK